MNLEYPFIIDGGLSNELEELGCTLNHKLWTARLLDSEEESIKKVHLNYMRAGAQCIATVSYQASMKGFMDHGYSERKAEELILKSVRLAEEARDIFYSENSSHQKVYIAASIGPYGAYLADGSEYRGDYKISFDELKSFHERRISIFENSSADILAFETIPSHLEAEVIAELTMSSNKPSWVSFSCSDQGHISDGTAISTCARIFDDHPSVFALGANCISPDLILGIVNSIKESGTDKKIIIYPNSGGKYDSQGKKWYANEELFSLKNHAKDWIESGVDILGGCCKIGSSEISELKDYVESL